MRKRPPLTKYAALRINNLTLNLCFILWKCHDMHWRRSQSGYWRSFQTKKTFLKVEMKIWSMSVVHLTNVLFDRWNCFKIIPKKRCSTGLCRHENVLGIFSVDVLAQICYSPNWILFMTLQRPTFNSQIHISRFSRNNGICVFPPHLMQCLILNLYIE